MLETTADPFDQVLAAWARTLPEAELTAMALSVHMTRMVHLVNREAEELVRPHGFGIGELELLFYLLNTGKPYETRPRDLMRGCFVTGGAITGRVDRLISFGLVSRTNSTVDRREMMVRLTPAGLKIAKTMRTKISARSNLSIALEGIEPARRRMLLATMRELYVNLNQISEQRATVKRPKPSRKSKAVTPIDA